MSAGLGQQKQGGFDFGFGSNQPGGGMNLMQNKAASFGIDAIGKNNMQSNNSS